MLVKYNLNACKKIWGQQINLISGMALKLCEFWIAFLSLPMPPLPLQICKLVAAVQRSKVP